jgi:hypothetical protein
LFDPNLNSVATATIQVAPAYGALGALEPEKHFEDQVMHQPALPLAVEEQVDREVLHSGSMQAMGLLDHLGPARNSEKSVGVRSPATCADDSRSPG